MKHIYTVLCLLLLSGEFSIANAQFIDTTWRVTGVVGEPWFANPEMILGRTQYFFKGEAEGVFYSCNYAGQSTTYTKYHLSEFLENKEFKLFKKHQTELMLRDERIMVHRISCNGKSESERRVFYPFVTFENWTTGFYLFEGAIYILQCEQFCEYL